ncbi:hypothetical protein PVK06_047182 [Gossypium arboreum]|uniref:Uncharacterized protein n=1 Tax=Gossypium arboreum TaxID=29729 RepID=A0ABR0MCR0_GOSAR|nr:hypothetical protein PVK06_047182 [Gossypium arboreum]
MGVSFKVSKTGTRFKPKPCLQLEASVDVVPDNSEESSWPRKLQDALNQATLHGAPKLHPYDRSSETLFLAKKLASQYQKEADKCNSGMETCEEVREKAEEALSAQMKLTAMWVIRARQKGWREKVAKSNAFPYFI